MQVHDQDTPVPCELCTTAGGETIWHDESCRVVLVDEPDYPGFCRVILNRHVAEMTDLQPEERLRLMEVVFGVEQAMRSVLAPHKINLASLGNAVPHLHWHVIARYRDDRHFPRPVWATPARDGSHALAAGARQALADAVRQALAATGIG